VPGFDADDAMMIPNADVAPHQHGRRDAAHPQDAKIPVGLYALDHGTDLVRVGLQHEVRRTALPGQGGIHIAHAIHAHLRGQPAQRISQVAHHRLLMPGDTVQGGERGEPRPQGTLEPRDLL